MNDWPIKKFLLVVLAVQLAVWGVIGLDAIGLQIPLVRQAIGFVYISFVPGVVILRVLKLHNIGSIETLGYSVGLSLATAMFTGVLVNGVYPSFGISAPISTIPLMISFTVLTLTLCVIAYIRDRDFASHAYINIAGIFSPPVLFLCLIPLISILGTQLVNSYQNNVILMVLIAIIAFTVLLISFNKFIPQSLYPLAVFSIALSLLFYRSLISQNVSGTDIHEEYYFANLVKLTGVWDSKSPEILVNMLSITMLAPIFSLISAIDITWVFKAIYPILFIVPLGIYQMALKQTDNKIAFLSSFFFMSVSFFFNALPVFPRQEIATIFLVLLTLLIIDQQIEETNKSILFIIFGASLVVSHYGLSYIFIFLVLAAWLILSIFNQISKFKRIRYFPNKLTLLKTLTPPRILFFVTFAFFWYMITSTGTVFERYTHIGQDIVIHFSESFLNPGSSQGLMTLLRPPKTGVLHIINALINYGNQIFILVGLLFLLIKFHKLKFTQEYVIFSALNLIIIFAGIFVPFLTLRVDMQRLYHIALIFLSPICIIGGLAVISLVNQLIESKVPHVLKSQGANILGIYFILFFLFESGFIWQATEQYFGSVSLSQENIITLGNSEQKGYFYSSVTPEQDVQSARWLASRVSKNIEIFASFNDAQVHPLTSYGMIPSAQVKPLSKSLEYIPEGDYVYLQYLNVVENIATEFNASSLSGMTVTTYKTSDIADLFAARDRIYTNGGSEIYR